MENVTKLSQKQLSIVIIDDDENATELLEYNFIKNGINTICFSDSNTAIKFLKENKVDVIVTDWMMPGKDGIELIESLKSSVNAGSKKFMVSCKSDEISINKAMDTGLDGYLSKPIRVKDFIDKVKECYSQAS